MKPTKHYAWSCLRWTAAPVLCLLLMGSPAQGSEEAARCRHQLVRVHEAIQRYRQAHQDLPPSLDSLVPDFLGEAEALRCPGSPAGPDGAYRYQFHAHVMIEPAGITQRQWKELQMALAGGRVPILRCRGHGERVHNLGFDGHFYESGLYWERHPELEAKVAFHELLPDSLVQRFSIRRVVGVPADQAIREQRGKEHRVQAARINATFLQSAGSCVLSSYGVVAQYFTGVPVPEFFSAYCRHFEIAHADALEAERKYPPHFSEEGVRRKCSGYEVILALHGHSSEGPFKAARQAFHYRFFERSADHLATIEEALKTREALCTLTYEPGRDYHSVTVFWDGSRFLVRDTNRPGFYQVHCLREIGTLRDAVLYFPASP